MECLILNHYLSITINGINGLLSDINHVFCLEELDHTNVLQFLYEGLKCHDIMPPKQYSHNTMKQDLV